MNKRANSKIYLLLFIVCMIGLFAACGAPSLGSSPEDSTEISSSEASLSEAELEALYEEGLGYYYAINGIMDRTKAKENFEKAAENGYADAYYYLGRLEDISFDYSSAMDFYEKGRNEGSALCAYGIAELYYGGKGIQWDFEKAKKYSEEAVEKGLVEANTLLGKIEQMGFEGESNPEKAIEYYEKAIKGNEQRIVADAYSQLASFYVSDSFGIEIDYKKAIDYYKKANDLVQNWDGGYMADISEQYRNMGDKSSEQEWMKKSADLYLSLAEEDVDYGMYAYGAYAFYGYGMDKDYQLAWDWFNKAAEKGNAPAVNFIGYIYSDSRDNIQKEIGIEKDFDKAIEMFKKSAAMGYPEAMENMGWTYCNGISVEKNGEEAIKWYENSVEAGSASALRYIGNIYINGIADEKDFEKAIDYYKKATGVGDIQSYNSLGVAYKNGTENHDPDYDLALSNFEKGAYLGNTDCMWQIGAMYQDGLGVNQSMEEAEKWYEKAGDAGNAKGYKFIGDNYHNGDGVEKDYEKAMEYYEKAENLGNGDAMNEIAYMYSFGEGVEKDFEKALEWLIKAGEHGTAVGYVNAGNMYYFGDLLGKPDYETAYEYYVKAADLGSTSAMNKIALMYYNGDGIIKDYNKAVEWLLKEGEMGDPEGYRLAADIMYNSSNYETAHEYAMKAAEMGHSDAMLYVGMDYYNGEGVEKDLQKALEWFQKAIDNGNEKAKEWYDLAQQALNQ